MTGQRSTGADGIFAATLVLLLLPQLAFAADLTREAVNSAKPGAVEFIE